MLIREELLLYLQSNILLFHYYKITSIMLKKAIIWFGIIGSVASIFSLIYIFLPINKNLKLEVKTISVENLTEKRLKTEPELRIIYKFKNEEISNLWKYTIKFTNISNKTLVGVSTQKNIITDYLTFNIQNGYDVIDKKLIFTDLNHSIVNDSNKIGLKFEQWRPNESIEYSFYIKTNQSTPLQIPFLNNEFRQIIDGDILFSYEKQNEEKRSITRTLPYQLIGVAYIISLLFLALLITALTIIFFLSPFSYFKTNNWYRKNYSNFIEFVKLNFKDSIPRQNLYIEKPKNLPSPLWEKFSGEKFPEVNMDFDFKKFYQIVLLEVILIAFDFSLIICVIDLIYIFPH
jgi:hypothetical protein